MQRAGEMSRRQPCPLPGSEQPHMCAWVWGPPGHTGRCQPDASSSAWWSGNPGKSCFVLIRFLNPAAALALAPCTIIPPVALWARNISALQETRRCPTSVERAGGDVPFFSPQMYGKWYDIAIGTTCTWMKNYKEKFSMGTLVLGPGPSNDQISTASTRLR